MCTGIEYLNELKWAFINLSHRYAECDWWALIKSVLGTKIKRFTNDRGFIVSISGERTIFIRLHLNIRPLGLRKTEIVTQNYFRRKNNVSDIFVYSGYGTYWIEMKTRIILIMDPHFFPNSHFHHLLIVIETISTKNICILKIICFK